MPRIAGVCATLIVGACTFHAVYDGKYSCSDGVCPVGYTCTAAKQCVKTGMLDARLDGDAPGDSVDAAQAALTCADPGTFGSAGGSASDTTTGRANHVSAMCGGVVMNANDAVYKFDATLGHQVTVSIAASYAANAYVITPCTVSPSTPPCVGSAYATPGNPLSFSVPATTTYYLVVDNFNVNLSGPYTVTLSLP